MPRKVEHLVKMPDGTYQWVPGPAPRRRYRTDVGWPMPSDSAGCHPDQVEEYKAYLKQEGCGDTEFTPGGRVILKSRVHADQVYSALGMHNKDEVKSAGKRSQIHY
jgi:hypothetical protein